MLCRFSVKGFKSFEEKIELDLSRTGNYGFSEIAVKRDIVNKGIIYGFNGCGKSNLGLALMDIVSHITDNQWNSDLYVPYINLNTDDKIVYFEYTFLFHGKTVIYTYKKNQFYNLLYEKLVIDNEKVLEYDFKTNDGISKLAGTETLNLKNSENNISRVKYISNNTIFRDDDKNRLFINFVDFVKGMLLFYSLDKTRYIGYKLGREDVGAAIVKEKKIKDFEAFLQNCKINMDLTESEVNGVPSLGARYQNGVVPFFSVASRGTRALALFYYWYIQMEKASFVFMDEFDAFYHFELAEYIVDLVKKLENVQVLFTTHNTDLLSNDILRPDCFFWMDESHVLPLCDLTEKELRKAHNLQKMFKAGAFNG